MKKLYSFQSKFSGVVFAFCFFVTVIAVKAQTTYYSYQSGNWNDASTWTQDPSGLVIDNPGVPANTDRVVILINRTVKLSADVVTTGHSITVETGGVLDFLTYTITPLTSLSGTGRLRFNQSYFPTVNTNNFVTAAGGTVEYYNFNGALPTNQLTYRNLVLSNTDAVNDYVMVLANPSAPTTYTLNGNLRLRSTEGQDLTITLGNAAENVINLNIGSAASNIAGTLRVGVNTLLNIGNYTFTPAGTLDKTHQITINGNLENNGRIDLTNAPQYKVATNGAATVIFTGATDNTITSPEHRSNLYSGCKSAEFFIVGSYSTSEWLCN
jgi:fibronectin-binding autotransporter adhesin